MNTKLIITIVISALVIIGAGVVFLSPALFRPIDSRPVIAATIFPVANIAEQVVGDVREVVLVVPPGASPHSYVVSPNQIAQLQRAQAVFAIGHGLDTAVVTSITNTVEGVEIAEVDRGITLREFGEEHGHEGEEEEEHEGEEGLDPHYWLTVSNAKKIAQTIRDTMQEVDPDNAQQYADNTDEYLAQLDALEVELQEIASGATQKDFVAIHDAWGYLAEAYGFELAGTFEPLEGREPSPVDIQELDEIIKEHGISAFYTEPQKNSAAATRLFEREFGLEVRVLDPIGGAPGRNSYVDLMRYNVSTLAQ